MVFLDLPGWAWLLIFVGVWLSLSLLDFFEPAMKAGRNAAIKDAIYDKRQRYEITNTEPARVIEYSFFGAWHRAEVLTITQVEPGVIAFTDTEGRDFLVHTDEWRVVHVPVGLQADDDE